MKSSQLYLQYTVAVQHSFFCTFCTEHMH